MISTFQEINCLFSRILEFLVQNKKYLLKSEMLQFFGVQPFTRYPPKSVGISVTEALQHKIFNRHCLVHPDYTKCVPAWTGVRNTYLRSNSSKYTVTKFGGVIYWCYPLHSKINEIYFDYFCDSLGLPPSATWLLFLIERFGQNCKMLLNS